MGHIHVYDVIGACDTQMDLEGAAAVDETSRLVPGSIVESVMHVLTGFCSAGSELLLWAVQAVLNIATRLPDVLSDTDLRAHVIAGALDTCSGDVHRHSSFCMNHAA